MYKRYNLSDIQKEVIELLRNNNPMSTTEISKKIGTNRITISKYLDILYFQKIINRKKIGSVNFWFLDPGIVNFDTKDENYIELQQKLIISLINGDKEISQNIILSILNKQINLKKIIIDICLPVLNTLFELHNRGKIGKTEKIHLITNLTESLGLLRNCNVIHESSVHRNMLLVIVAGDDDSLPICNIMNIYARKIKINSTVIGNVEKYIDPFFDIDFRRYINKISNRNKEKICICIISYNEMSIKFLSAAVDEIEQANKVKTIVFSTKKIIEKFENNFKGNFIADVASLITVIENEVK
jgi:DNA-binding Lrp family transcriptional regulator